MAGLVAAVLTTLCLAASASGATFCVQKIACPGTFENNLSEALTDAAANGERDRIELGAYIDTTPAVNGAGSPVDIVGAGDSSVLQGGGGDVVRLKIQEPTSTVSSLQVRLKADHSTGIETNGLVQDVAVTADPPADQTLVGVLMKGTSTLDRAGVFLPRTANTDTTGVRTEGVGVKTITGGAAEGETGILVVNDPPLGPANNAIVRGAFVRANVGIVANQSQVFVDDALVEAGSAGLDAFAVTASAALRARQVTVVGPGAANSAGVESTDIDGAGPLTSSVDVSNSIVTGFGRDVLRAGGGALDINWSRYATTGTTPPTGANNTSAAPAFADPATRDFRLTAGSAMVDAGDPGGLASDEPTVDLDRLPRLVNGDGDCTARRDLGAFEYHPGQRAPTAATASATPGSVDTGQAVTFSGTACDPDGDSLAFSWSFDDGTSATGAQVTKAFATGGTHSGTLTVSDPGGRSVTKTASVAVVAPPLSILSFSMLRRTFAVGSAPTPLSAAGAKPKRGSAFRYSLSTAGDVTITIHALLGGRISKGKCVKPTRKLRSAKKCTRAVKRGTLRRTGAAGANNVPFSGRIGKLPLVRGSYRATIAAPGAKSRAVRFTIVKGA
jgi:hypothetical protein